jgi:transcriptional regulator with XRE-family HTH domain
MWQDSVVVEERVRTRLRSLRTDRGWTLEEMSARSQIAASTISRLETGRRRLGLDQLVPLAAALGTTIEELMQPAPADRDVIIRPEVRHHDGATVWTIGPPLDGRVILRIKYSETRSRPATRTHPGRDWLYVMTGTLWLALDDRDLSVPEGRAARFDTNLVHGFGGRDGPVDVLMIIDGISERSHLSD